MNSWIYLNGQFVKRDDAKVSIFDRGLLYGDGIFEGIRVYEGNIFKCEEHVDRLFDSAKAIGLDIGMTKEEMTEALVQAVRKNNKKNAYIRLVVTRGIGTLGLDPIRSIGQPVIFIVVEELTMFPPEMYEQGIKTITVATRSNSPGALNPKIKSLNYLNNIMAKEEANLAGVGEALLLNADGYVTEGTTDNVFVVKRGKIYTPPCYLGVLEGITRNTIIELALFLGYTVKEEPFTRYDLYTADEIFLTGTAIEMIPVIDVDGRPIGTGSPGEITRQLVAQFQTRVHRDGVQAFSEEEL